MCVEGLKKESQSNTLFFESRGGSCHFYELLVFVHQSLRWQVWVFGSAALSQELLEDRKKSPILFHSSQLHQSRTLAFLKLIIHFTETAENGSNHDTISMDITPGLSVGFSFITLEQAVFKDRGCLYILLQIACQGIHVVFGWYAFIGLVFEQLFLLHNLHVFFWIKLAMAIIKGLTAFYTEPDVSLMFLMKTSHPERDGYSVGFWLPVLCLNVPGLSETSSQAHWTDERETPPW